ncbi:MAG: AAA family ATPase [Thermodesulfobacteriota bacterium]
MYLNFYGFREKPFNLTPDPRFVFLSKTHKEAFAHLLYGINNRAGFIALTGEVGSGKTTVLRALLSQLDADHHRTALIFNPCLSPEVLLQNINREFGIPTNISNNPSFLDSLNVFLLQQNAEGRTVVLVIDEAQNLEAAVLEQIRLISNLETDREKLIQIVLAGQPEFVQMLKKNEMRQLSQRINVRYHLQAMDFDDTIHYINHRLGVAGGRGETIFTRRALQRIYGYSRGLPRLVNAACDRALLAGYTRDTTKIDSSIATAGIKDMRRGTASYTRKRRLILIPTLGLLAAIFATGIYFKWYDLTHRFDASQRVNATEEPTNKDPVITRDELSRAMAVELGKTTEAGSARRAFNILAGLWNVPPFPESPNSSRVSGLEREALDRELRLYRFSGNLGALLRINYPAVVEMTVPGIRGRRFVSLVGIEDERLLIDPPIVGRKSLSFRELEKHWSGRGFVLWKDPLNLLRTIPPESKGAHIKQLQDLLREAGAYSKPLTGVYDEETLLAVKGFQSSRGIEQDGIVGGQTLMLLYGSINRFGVPRLSVGPK